jgi:Zn-dependent peptidase ImmA (M78 family)
VLAHLNLLEEAVAYLTNRRVALPPINIPTVDDVKSPEDVERAAEHCRAHWGLGLDAPISNMTRVLENAGAVLAHFADTSDRIDAFSCWSSAHPLVVRSTGKKSATRARMDFSHELGHLVIASRRVT